MEAGRKTRGDNNSEEKRKEEKGRGKKTRYEKVAQGETRGATRNIQDHTTTHKRDDKARQSKQGEATRKQTIETRATPHRVHCGLCAEAVGESTPPPCGQEGPH